VPRARALALLLVLAAPGVAAAAEVTVLCSRAVQHVVAAAAQDFQRQTRHTVWLSYGTGQVVAARALAGGADVVVADEAALSQLEDRGAVRRGSRVSLGRVGLGVAVRTGVPLPDVSSERALRRAILQAVALGYADPAGGGQATQVASVLDALGIAAIVLPKTMVFPDGLRMMEALARDRITLALAPVSEIVGRDGVTLAGPLPEPVQRTLVYAAAVLSGSAAPDVASAFLAHLRNADVREKLRTGGLDPD
jgi:molybdate transport system substrate-binding protein